MHVKYVCIYAFNFKYILVYVSLCILYIFTYIKDMYKQVLL